MEQAAFARLYDLLRCEPEQEATLVPFLQLCQAHGAKLLPHPAWKDMFYILGTTAPACQLAKPSLWSKSHAI